MLTVLCCSLNMQIWDVLVGVAFVINGELKKRQWLLQRKGYFKIELLGWLGGLFFHVGHVVRRRQSDLSLAWYEWFSFKGRKWKIYCCFFKKTRSYHFKIKSHNCPWLPHCPGNMMRACVRWHTAQLIECIHLTFSLYFSSNCLQFLN